MACLQRKIELKKAELLLAIKKLTALTMEVDVIGVAIWHLDQCYVTAFCDIACPLIGCSL